MPYIGNPAVVGDSANTFRLLDDITSFTVTFDATDAGVVSIANDTLTFSNHRFVTGQKVTYNDGGGTAIGGLADGSYFIIKEDQSTIKLATNASNAASGTAINLTGGAAGSSHTLNIAFDGVNTKFKATFNNGTKAKISRAAQLSLSINGVLQQPQDTQSPTVGYGIAPDSTIVFSTAPVSSDKIFGSFIGEVAASFDIADNTVDEFTANGSSVTFTLSKTVSSNNDILVTLDGVTQYPNTQSTTRAYSVLENVLTFTSAPAAGVVIQVRHIGFGGASSSEVTGFYGRTGNVALKSTDDVAVQNISAGIVTFTGDSKVGSGITLSPDGDGFFTGIVTATFAGDGTNLTGVASTDNIRSNTNATFLQNVNVSGTATVGGTVKVGTGVTATNDGDLFFTGVCTATTFSGSGANLTNIPDSSITALAASKLASGTIPDARFPATLPAVSGANLTNIPSVADINNLINNIAMLGFKIATNGSLTKYDLVDQAIDEFTDASGIDASASTNETLTGGYYVGQSGSNPTGGTISTSTISGTEYRIHTFTSSGNFVTTNSGTLDMLIVGGGGGGGNYLGGGGGGGSALLVQSRDVTAATYAVSVGAGGAGGQDEDTADNGHQGTGSYFGSDYASTYLFARPGGGGAGHGTGQGDANGTYAQGTAAVTISGTGNGGGGASAGASAGVGYDPTDRSVSAPSGETWTLYSNNAGGTGNAGGSHASGGGGGAGGAGANGGGGQNGGVGAQINIDGNNYYWGGGGGGGGITRQSSGSNGGLGGGGGGSNQSGGGGTGGGSAINSGSTASDGNTYGGSAGANSGGGGGGGGHGDYDGGSGGSGIVIVRYASDQFQPTADLTLQSVDSTALSAPSTADFIMLIEDGSGTATLNTDVKAFISRDSGSNFTQGTLVDEGTWGATTKRIVAFHNLDISSQPSGTSICYKVTTHNQSGGVKETRIHAVSHGWK